MAEGDFENIKLQIGDGVATLSLDRPEHMNVFNIDMLNELEAALDWVNFNPRVKAVVLKSSSDKAFTAGADVRYMSGLDSKRAHEFAELGHRVSGKLAGLNQPIIAALRGFTMGGGVEFACACDMRIAAEDTLLAQPEINIGIIPGWGGTQRLVKLVGPGFAKYLIYSGMTVTAQEALRMHLVDFVVPADKLDEAAMEMAMNLSAKSRLALFQAKRSINVAIEHGAAQGLSFERDVWAKLFDTKDQKEGMAAFLEKRKPCFRDE